MRIPRIYHPELITAGREIALSDDAANHVGRVLRMGAGQAIQLFDGSNQVFDAEITRSDKKAYTLTSCVAKWMIGNHRCTSIWAR